YLNEHQLDLVSVGFHDAAELSTHRCSPAPGALVQLHHDRSTGRCGVGGVDLHTDRGAAQDVGLPDGCAGRPESDRVAGGYALPRPARHDLGELAAVDDGLPVGGDVGDENVGTSPARVQVWQARAVRTEGVVVDPNQEVP